MQSIKAENGTSGFFTTTPLMGVRTLLKPTSSTSNSLKMYCGGEKGEDDEIDEPQKTKLIRGMEISGSNGRFGKEDTARCSTMVY